MKNLHTALTEKFPWYARWHTHKNCNHAHWAFLVLASLLTLGGILLGIRNYQARLEALLVDIAPVTGMETRPLPGGRAGGVFQNYVLVKFKTEATQAVRDAVLARGNLRSQAELREIGVHVVSIHSQKTPAQVVQDLTNEESAYVEFAEVDAMVAPSAIPNDPWFANWQKDKQQIGAPAAWDATTGSPALIVAVADTGVDCIHEDLAAQCMDGWNFYDGDADVKDVNGHGTKVAGVIAAQGNNNIGVAGSAWNARILPLRVSDLQGYASYSAIAKSITYAADHSARLVNASYQVSGSRTVRSAAYYMRKKGGLVTVSAGNAGIGTGYTASPDIITVSATDPNDAAYAWSSFGDDVDISAPGCTGATTQKGGGYGSFCGTSNSAPEIAGVLALVWSAQPGLSPDQAQSVLFSSAVDLGAQGWDPVYGWGRVDANAAVQKALTTVVESPSLQQGRTKKK